MHEPSQFTFIDFRGQQDAVDAVTLSRIRSHSMRRVRKDRKAHAQQAAHARHRAQHPLLAVKDHGSPSPDRALRAPVAYPACVDEPQHARTPSDSSSSSVDPDEAVTEILSQGLHPCPRPAIYGQDPFSSFPIRIDAQVARCIESYYAATSWKWEGPAEMLVPDTLADPCLLHSFLAIASANIAHTNPEGQSLVLWHENETIKHVRELMRRPKTQASDSVIWAMARITAFSVAHFGQPSVSCQHMLALATMVELRGSLDKLGHNGQVRYMVEGVVLSGAPMWWDQVPPILRYPYGDLKTSALSDLADKGISSKPDTAFASSSASCFLSPTLIDIYAAIASLNSVADQVVTVTPGVHRLLSHEGNKLAMRLTYLGERQPVFQSTGSSQIRDDLVQKCGAQAAARMLTDEIFRLAAIFFLWIYQRGVPNVTPMHVITGQMEAILAVLDIQVVFPEHSWQRDLLLWALILVGSAVTTESKQQYYLNLIRKHFTSLASKAQSINPHYIEIQNLCRRFLWLETTCPRPTSAFWDRFQADHLDMTDDFNLAMPQYFTDRLQHMRWRVTGRT